MKGPRLSNQGIDLLKRQLAKRHLFQLDPRREGPSIRRFDRNRVGEAIEFDTCALSVLWPQHDRRRTRVDDHRDTLAVDLRLRDEVAVSRFADFNDSAMSVDTRRNSLNGARLQLLYDAVADLPEFASIGVKGDQHKADRDPAPKRL